MIGFQSVNAAFTGSFYIRIPAMMTIDASVLMHISAIESKWDKNGISRKALLNYLKAPQMQSLKTNLLNLLSGSPLRVLR